MRAEGSSTKYPGVKLVSNGLYRVRGKFTDPRSSQPKEVDKVVSAASAKDAAAIRGRLLEEAAAARNMGRMTVGAFSKFWIDSKECVVSRYSLQSYINSLHKHVLPALGEFFYDAIGPIEVQMWVNSCLKLKDKKGKPLYS